jgi:putative ABC transport system substrate-binding protein
LRDVRVAAESFRRFASAPSPFAQYRLPSIYARTQFVEDGGLMSYGAGSAADGRAMARLVQRVFTGAQPAELPVEQPTEFELVINMKAARQLGLTIPQSLSVRADRLIDWAR